MKCFRYILHRATNDGIDLQDITEDIRALVASSGVRAGFVTLASDHTTTGLTINENEPRLLEDIRRFFTRLVPAEDRYLHNDIHLRDCPPDEPENAHSHLLAMLMGSSEVIPIADAQLDLGRWQSVMLVELDGPRDRRVKVQVIGD